MADPCPWWGGGEFLDYVGIETQLDGTFRLVAYDNFETKTSTEWEVYRRTAAQVELVGFHDMDEGGGTTDITFSTPLPILPFPIAPGNFSVTSTATEPEVGLLDINWSGTVVGQEDLPALSDQFNGGVFWKDTWKVIIEFVVSSGGELFFTSTETYWFAPTVGIVKSTIDEEGPNEPACTAIVDGFWLLEESNLSL